MKKKVLFGLMVSLAVVLVGGGLLASNMGFKLNYVLDGPGTNGSLTGNNTIALPFNQQTNLVNANDLLVDIGGTTVVANIGNFDRTLNSFLYYSGTSGTPFALVAGDAYLVQLKSTVPSVNYIIVGSHDPGLVITFDGPGNNGSVSGNNFYAYPYHSTSTLADELLNELGGTAVVANIGQFDRSLNSFLYYSGTSGTPFGLQPGKGYLVQLKATTPSVSFVPSHF